MKPYIYSIIFLLGTQISFSQTTKVLLKKKYSVNENTILNLDLSNADVSIIESKDNKIYLDYEISFYNYSKQKVANILDKSIIKASKRENQIFLRAENSMYLGIDIKYRANIDFKNFKNPINNAHRDFLKKYIKTLKGDKYLHKTKDSLIREIDYSIGTNMNNFIKKNINEYPLRQPLKTDKKIVKEFIIQVPRYVQLKIKTLESDINCNFDISEDFKMNSFKGNFKFKKIEGENNQITSSNGIIETYGIRNARVELRDMHKVNIGDISNSKINSENSKIQIGEVGENVSIIDLDSKYYNYNFSDDFKEFNLKGDYTELNLYKVKESNYTMDVFGHNTVLKMDQNSTSFGNSKEKKLTKILQKKQKENVKSSGNISIELKNGILNIN